MKNVMKFALVATIIAVVAFVGCKKEEEVEFALSSLKAGDVDINGATAATTVAADAAIVATFAKDVDASAKATLVQDYDKANIEVTVAVSGKTITITPKSKLGGGTMYMLTIEGIKSTTGETLSNVARSFTTAGSFVPTGQFAYWSFDGNTNDEIGSFDPTASGVVSITYGADRKGVAGKAAMFDGDKSIVEIPNGDQLINAEKFTLSFWVKTNSDGHVDAGGNPTGHFVMGLGAFYGLQFEIFGGYDGSKFAIQYDLSNGKAGAEDMWMPSDAKDNTNGGWQGWDYAKSVPADQMKAMLKDKWLHVVYTFNGSDRKGILYFNGVKMKSFDFDLWPDGDDKRNAKAIKYAGKEPDVKNELAFGFIHSRGGTMWDAEPWGGYEIPTANHFKGSLDEVRIFHKALSSQEVELMYNSEKGN